ncbi:hypothetical protein ABZU76_47230 [Amycolatopsis sp. NPDC005232]|uniref:hypothetical protein n=1 Tax=Amycolatopsis sp. NPDC005232 TaxID=3157027 RepID=UPI0033AD1395
MRNIPCDLSNYTARVAEAPEPKTRKDENGREVAVTDRDGVRRYVASLFLKTKGEKGEEVRFTLDADPGDEFEEGMVVELVAPRMSPYSFKNANGETVSGVAFAAVGLKPVASF